MKFKAKVIITDIDGTYTGSDEGVRKNNEAIEYFKSEGGLFGHRSDCAGFENMSGLEEGFGESVSLELIFRGEVKVYIGGFVSGEGIVPDIMSS